jgi:hypothetical protein
MEMKQVHIGMCVIFALAALATGCGHTHTSRVALISFGDLEGKQIPAAVDGPVLEGQDFGTTAFSNWCALSRAVREALAGTKYDTLVDVDVTTHTGLLVASNRVSVKGKALDSTALRRQGGMR